MGQTNIERGKKWTEVLAHAEFYNDKEGIEWIKKQESIQKDIQEYDNSKPQPRGKGGK